MTSIVSQMTDKEIEEKIRTSDTSRESAVAFRTWLATLSQDDRNLFFNRLQALDESHRPHGIGKFFRVVGDIVTLRFADAAEMAEDGDTEN